MTGVVVDENGKPLPGVTVVIKGSMLGVATDAEGRFEIVSPEGKTLVFTYVGRKTQEVAFDAGTTDIKVVMPVEDVELEAVESMDNKMRVKEEKTTVTLNHVTKETLAYLMGKKAPRSLGGAERELFDQLREKEGNLFVLIKGHGEQPAGFDLRTLNPDSIDMITVTLSEEVLTSYGKREKAKAMVVVDLKNVSDDGGGVLKEVGAGEGLNDRMAGTGKEGNTVVEQGEVYKVVEDLPRFPDGNVQQYIAWNLHYPEKALKNKVEGKVFVQFVIDTTGKVVEPKVIKSVSPELDAEALRVVSGMPAWKPGMQRGKPVRVSFTLPVIFKLPTPEGAAPDDKVQVSTMVADSICIMGNSVTGSGNPKGQAYECMLSELRSKIKETPLIFVGTQQQEAGFDLASLDPQMVEHVMLCWGTRVTYMDGQKLDNQTVVMVKMKEGK